MLLTYFFVILLRSTGRDLSIIDLPASSPPLLRDAGRELGRLAEFAPPSSPSGARSVEYPSGGPRVNGDDANDHGGSVRLVAC